MSALERVSTISKHGLGAESPLQLINDEGIARNAHPVQFSDSHL